MRIVVRSVKEIKDKDKILEKDGIRNYAIISEDNRIYIVQSKKPIHDDDIIEVEKGVVKDVNYSETKKLKEKFSLYILSVLFIIFLMLIIL